MEKNEPNMHAYTDVMMKKAHLDWEMECLQTKIKCKNEENSKLENQISERKNELEKLRKSASTSCEREEKVKNNINMLRNSRTISEGLLMSMKHQLRILEEKRIDTRNVRKNIIEKYSKLFESHAKIYSNLPWVQKINEVKLSIRNKQIHLEILKLEYSSIKRKISLFHRIQDQRKVAVITQLAKYLVSRNNLQKEVEVLFSKQNEYQSRITLLEENKIKLQEKIDLKIKEALDEARGRVVRKHVGTGEKNTTVAATPNVVTSFGTNFKPTNESIFSRLGLSVPLSMQRLLTPSSRVLSRVMEEQSTRKDFLVTEKISAVQEKLSTTDVPKDKQTTEENTRVIECGQGVKQDIPRRKDIQQTEKINRINENSLSSELVLNKQTVGGNNQSVSQALKRPSTSSPNISEKMPHLIQVAQKNKAPGVENVCLNPEKFQHSKEKDIMPNKDNSENLRPVTASEPASTDTLNIQTEAENKRNTDQNVKKNLKNKAKKDANAESTSLVHVSENTKSNITGNYQNAIAPENSLRESGIELPNNPPEKHVTFANTLQEMMTEKDDQPQKQVMRETEHQEETAQEKTITNEVEMNDSNLSVLDNISVVSSTFTNENRNQMAKSPDFLNQIPQGYCFSPMYSPTKGDSISEVSSVKGPKSPSNNFPITSIASPLFPMDAQPTVGPSSDFSSFFGTSSPKKSENSSKNFFQLFG